MLLFHKPNHWVIFREGESSGQLGCVSGEVQPSEQGGGLPVEWHCDLLRGGDKPPW